MQLQLSIIYLHCSQPKEKQNRARFSSFLNLLSPTIRAAGVFNQKLISPVVLFPRIFSIQQEHLFSGPSVRVCYLFFFPDCNVSNKNLPFCFFKKSDVLYQLSTDWNLEFIQLFRIFPWNFPPLFQNKEATFKRCFVKAAVQQNDVTKYSYFGPEVKSRKVLHANLLKIAFHPRYFSKNLTTSSEQRY